MSRNADENKGTTYQENFKIGYAKQAVEKKLEDGKNINQVRK